MGMYEFMNIELRSSKGVNITYNPSNRQSPSGTSGHNFNFPDLELFKDSPRSSKYFSSFKTQSQTGRNAEVAFDQSGNIYVLYEMNPEDGGIQKYSPSGDLLSSFGSDLISSSCPYDFDIDSSGNLYVAGCRGHQNAGVTILSNDGTFIHRINSGVNGDPVSGWDCDPNIIKEIRSLSVDSSGNIMLFKEWYSKC